MQFIKVFCIILLVVYAVVLLYFCYKSGKFLKTLLLSAVSGIAAMAVVNLLSRFTGVSLPVNPYTAVSSGVLGIPGVLGLLTVRLFF